MGDPLVEAIVRQYRIVTAQRAFVHLLRDDAVLADAAEGTSPIDALRAPRDGGSDVPVAKARRHVPAAAAETERGLACPACGAALDCVRERGVGRFGLLGTERTYRCGECGREHRLLDMPARIACTILGVALVAFAAYVHWRTSAEPEVLWLKILMLGGIAGLGAGAIARVAWALRAERAARAAFEARGANGKHSARGALHPAALRTRSRERGSPQRPSTPHS